MSRLVFVGSVNADTIAVVPHLPSPDERLVADRIVNGGGGNAATAAVAAARLGAEAAFVGPVSDDELGRYVEAMLVAEGVETSGLISTPPDSGGRSIVLVDRASGTRAICVQVAPPFVVPPSGRAADLIRSASWVHVDYLGWSAVRGLTDLDPGRLSIDAGNDIPELELAGVGLYGPTVPALCRRYGELPVEDLLRCAVDEGAVRVVATDGSHGSFAIDANGDLLRAPAYDIEAVSTLGAGDVYHGALVAAVDKGMPLAEAMAYANGTAALSCRAIDGRTGIPTEAELLGWLADAPVRA